MSTLGYISAKSSKLLSDPRVQQAMGAAGTAALAGAKTVVIAAAPYVIPFAVGAAAAVGLMNGVSCVVEKVAKSD